MHMHMHMHMLPRSLPAPAPARAYAHNRAAPTCKVWVLPTPFQCNVQAIIRTSSGHVALTGCFYFAWHYLGMAWVATKLSPPARPEKQTLDDVGHPIAIPPFSPSSPPLRPGDTTKPHLSQPSPRQPRSLPLRPHSTTVPSHDSRPVRSIRGEVPPNKEPSCSVRVPPKPKGKTRHRTTAPQQLVVGRSLPLRTVQRGGVCKLKLGAWGEWRGRGGSEFRGIGLAQQQRQSHHWQRVREYTQKNSVLLFFFFFSFRARFAPRQRLAVDGRRSHPHEDNTFLLRLPL